MDLTAKHYRRGEIAYQAYCRQSGGKSLVTGDALSAFSKLSTAIRDAWAAVGIALSVADDLEARRSTARRCADIAAKIGAAEFPANTGYCAGEAIKAEIEQVFGLKGGGVMSESFKDGETRQSLDCRIRDQRDRLSYLEAENARLREDKERLEIVRQHLANAPELNPAKPEVKALGGGK